MSKQSNLVNTSQDITVDSSGNLGIGTSSPSGAKLHVTGSNYNDQLVVERTDTSSKWSLAGADSGGFQIYDVNSGNATRMNIDSAGRVTTPYQPAFYGAYTGVNVGWANNQTFGWNVVHMNVGNHFNGATGLFTAPVTGVYSFNYSAWAESGPTQVCFKVNGADFRPAGADTQGIANITFADGQRTGGTTIVIPLAAGDYVHVGMRTGFADTIYMGHSHFSGYLIG